MSEKKKLEYNGTVPGTWNEYLVYELNRCIMVRSFHMELWRFFIN